MQRQYINIKKLYLSHNYLKTLSGIEILKNLTHLSVSYNKLSDLDEFARVSNPSKLECLGVKGNLMIELHPDHRALLVDYFPNLKELDCANIQKENLKLQARLGQKLKKLLIPFIYRIDKILCKLEEETSELKANEFSPKVADLAQVFDILFQMKDLRSMPKISAKLLLTHIQLFNEKVVDRPDSEFKYMPENRKELFYLYKWLFQETLITLTSPNLMRNNELTRYLNNVILLNNPDLLAFISEKHKINEAQLERQLELAGCAL